MCIDLCVATKTLSVDEEAYLHLVRAKRDSKESFSKVIKRARWDQDIRTCAGILARTKGKVKEETLDRLDRGQAEDSPPPESWRR